MASCSLATTEALPGTMARTKELLPSWHTRSLSRPTTRCSRSLVRRTMVPSLASPVPTSGATWDDGKNEGIITELAYSIAVSPNNPLFTIIGTQDNGTFSRVASTDIWEQTLGGDGIGTAWSKSPVNNDVAFASFPGGSTVVAVNTPPNIQAKWAFARNGINRRFGNFFTAYASPSAAADPTGQVFFNYTSREIYRTANAGGLWTDIGHTTIPGSGSPPGPSTPPSPGNTTEPWQDSS